MKIAQNDNKWIDYKAVPLSSNNEQGQETFSNMSAQEKISRGIHPTPTVRVRPNNTDIVEDLPKINENTRKLTERKIEMCTPKPIAKPMLWQPRGKNHREIRAGKLILISFVKYDVVSLLINLSKSLFYTFD